MSVNIACSVPGCTNPVIGQCTGYKKSCGRYYCHAHSTDTLCAVCANHKAEDDRVQIIYQDYLTTAEGLEREARTTITFKGTFKKGWKIAAIIGLIGGPILTPILSQPKNFALGVGAFFLGFLVGPVELLVAYAIYGSLIAWIVCGVKRGNWHKEIGINRAKELDTTKPGFLEFYTTWRKEKSKEKLTKALAVAGVVAAVGLAAAVGATGESDYDRTRRAVRDELNR
jgi:hypothetical protein